MPDCQLAVTFAMNPRKMQFIVRLCIYLPLFLTIAALTALSFRDEIVESWHLYQKEQTIDSIDQSCNRLPPVDEVRLLRLDIRPHKDDQGHYDLGGSSNDRLYIVQSASLSGAEAERLASAWRSLTFVPGSITACFDPHHVVRFLSKGKLLSEAVVCFQCGNATIPSFPRRAMITMVSVEEVEKASLQVFQSGVEAAVGAFTKDTSN